MSARKVVAVLSLSGTVLVLDACHHGHKMHRRDSSTEPSEAYDGGSICPPTGCVDGGSEGVAEIHGEFNYCPRVSLEVTPVQARFDQPILVTSRTIDPDGDTLSYEWSADPDGQFDKPDSPVTYYRCQSLGRKMLHLIATDQHGCDAADDVEVSCVDVNEFLRLGTSQIVGGP